VTSYIGTESNTDGWVADNRRMMERRHDPFRTAFIGEGTPPPRGERHSSHGCATLCRQNGRRLPVPRRGGRTLTWRSVRSGAFPFLRLAFGNIQEGHSRSGAALPGIPAVRTMVVGRAHYVIMHQMRDIVLFPPPLMEGREVVVQTCIVIPPLDPPHQGGGDI
jgi:hypothetical protein